MLKNRHGSVEIKDLWHFGLISESKYKINTKALSTLISIINMLLLAIGSYRRNYFTMENTQCCLMLDVTTVIALKVSFRQVYRLACLTFIAFTPCSSARLHTCRFAFCTDRCQCSFFAGYKDGFGAKKPLLNILVLIFVCFFSAKCYFPSR